MRLPIRSLSAKIALLSVGISALLAGGLTVAGYRKAAAGLRARTETALAADASLTANLVDTWMRERQGSLRALARLTSIRRALETAASPAVEDLEATDRALGDAAALAPEIETIALVAPDGKVVRSSDGTDEGRNMSPQPWVQEAIAGKGFIGGVPGKAVVYFGVPVIGSNATPIGAAYVRAGLAEVRGFVAAAKNRLGSGAHGLLLDDVGVVVATTIDGVAPQRPVTFPSLAALQGIDVAATTRFMLDGTQQLAVGLPLKNTRWVFVASLPMSEVERSAREFLANATAGALLGLAVALALALWFARRLTRSIKHLTEVSARVVEKGDLTQRIEVESEDEVGQLARSFARMVEALREVLGTLKVSAGTLSDAASSLNAIMQEQGQYIAQQATTLQETQVTTQEIRQTSALAAEKAQAVLQVAERAEEIGTAGATSIDRSLGGLSDIGHQAREVGNRIQELSESARQISGITMTVKDLADQSNMLALNAAIEAVRSGAHGRSFAVVAREIRSLADQSIRATVDVGQVLENLTRSIGTAVAMTESSTQRMEAGIVEVTSSGEKLRTLTGITRENVAAVRQIAAAVSQQNAGIAQIFTSLTDQMAQMERVRTSLEQTAHASNELSEVAAKVSRTLERYEL